MAHTRLEKGESIIDASQGHTVTTRMTVRVGIQKMRKERTD
jgi:hypothetical protein